MSIVLRKADKNNRVRENRALWRRYNFQYTQHIAHEKDAAMVAAWLAIVKWERLLGMALSLDDREKHEFVSERYVMKQPDQKSRSVLAAAAKDDKSTQGEAARSAIHRANHCFKQADAYNTQYAAMPTNTRFAALVIAYNNLGVCLLKYADELIGYDAPDLTED